MAISNKFGSMVVTTGNKSEMSVGYATLYGDMNGGFNPIKDIYKTEVFRLSRLRNEWKPDGALGPSGEVIPANIITRPPTAELRENQTDQDSLPPYEVLDGILERLVEREEPLAAIVAAGFPAEVVTRIERLLNVAEYKRRQAAPGVKVTGRTLAATAAIPSPTASATMARRCPSPTRSWSSAPAARRRTYLTDRLHRIANTVSRPDLAQRRQFLRHWRKEQGPYEVRVFGFENHDGDEDQHRHWRQQDGVDQGQPLPGHVHEDGDDQARLQHHEQQDQRPSEIAVEAKVVDEIGARC